MQSLLVFFQFFMGHLWLFIFNPHTSPISLSLAYSILSLPLSFHLSHYHSYPLLNPPSRCCLAFWSLNLFSQAAFAVDCIFLSSFLLFFTHLLHVSLSHSYFHFSLSQLLFSLTHSPSLPLSLFLSLSLLAQFSLFLTHSSVLKLPPSCRFHIVALSPKSALTLW